LPCAITRELAIEVPLFTKDNVLFAHDIEDLVETARNPHALARVANSGHRLFEEKLSASKMAESYEQLYLDAISQRADQLEQVVQYGHRSPKEDSLLKRTEANGA
jgi:hypothetical protein